MKIKYLLGKARAFKTRSRCCSNRCMSMRTSIGRKRRYKRGGSIRGKLSSMGKFIYKHRNKLAAAAAVGAAFARQRNSINASNLIRSQPLF